MLTTGTVWLENRWKTLQHTAEAALCKKSISPVASESTVAQQLQSPLPSWVVEKLHVFTEERATSDFSLFYFWGWQPFYSSAVSVMKSSLTWHVLRKHTDYCFVIFYSPCWNCWDLLVHFLFSHKVSFPCINLIFPFGVEVPGGQDFYDQPSL